MVTLIKGLAGPYQNKYFKVSVGMTLGRRQGDILLEDDNTVSSLHGRVISLPSGNLCLKDADSQNQFLLNNRKVDSVTLTEGTVFQIGQCIFQVIRVSEKEAEKLPWQKNWKDLLFETLKKNQGLVPSLARALEPTVQVECVLGPSAGSSWFLGFGPRVFGPLSHDIEFLEKGSRDIAFEILQQESGPTIRILTPKTTINHKELQQKVLEDGDEVQVGSSIFKIRLE